jgi:hypothetical protein
MVYNNRFSKYHILILPGFLPIFSLLSGESNPQTYFAAVSAANHAANPSAAPKT